jgi:hypothetical protein
MCRQEGPFACFLLVFLALKLNKTELMLLSVKKSWQNHHFLTETFGVYKKIAYFCKL